MRVRRVDPLVAVTLFDAVRRVQVFGQFGSLQMPGLEQHSARALLYEPAGSTREVVFGANFQSGQILSFRNIRRYESRQRENMAQYRLDGRLGDQAISRRSDHHGIHHDMPDPVLPDQAGRLGDYLLRGKHPQFHRIDPYVFQHGIDLSCDYVCRNGIHSAYALRILNRHGRYGGHAVAAAGRDRFQIGLNAGSASAVRAGDRKYPFESFHSANVRICGRFQKWRNPCQRGRIARPFSFHRIPLPSIIRPIS